MLEARNAVTLSQAKRSRNRRAWSSGHPWSLKLRDWDAKKTVVQIYNYIYNMVRFGPCLVAVLALKLLGSPEERLVSGEISGEREAGSPTPQDTAPNLGFRV